MAYTVFKTGETGILQYYELIGQGDSEQQLEVIYTKARKEIESRGEFVMTDCTDKCVGHKPIKTVISTIDELDAFKKYQEELSTCRGK